MCVCHPLHSNPSPPSPPTPTSSQVIVKNPLKHVISLDCKEKVIFLKWAFCRLEVARPPVTRRQAALQRISWNSANSEPSTRSTLLPPASLIDKAQQNPRKNPSSEPNGFQARLRLLQRAEQPWKWTINGTFSFTSAFHYGHNTPILSLVCT